MRRIAAIVVAVSKHWTRSREALFFSLVFPIVLLLIFSAVFAGSGSAEFALYVQNNDLEDGEPSELSAVLVSSLEESSVLDVQHIDAGRDVGAWADDHEGEGATRVLVIHDGFDERVRERSGAARANVTQSTLSELWPLLEDSTRADLEATLDEAAPDGAAGESATVTLLTTPDDSSAPTVRGIVGSHLSAFEQGVIGIEQSPTTLESGTVGDEELGAVDYFLPALIAAVLLINAVITLPSMVAQIGHDGTLKRLVATPLRRWEWLAAHLLVQSVLSVVILALMVVTAHLAFGVTVVPGPLAVGLVLLTTVGFSALGLTIGGWVSDPDAASTIGNVIAFPVLFLSGAFWQIELMPGYLQTVGTALPLYHVHQGLRQLMVMETTDGVLVPVAVLSVMTVVFLATAWRVTRWKDF